MPGHNYTNADLAQGARRGRQAIFINPEFRHGHEWETCAQDIITDILHGLNSRVSFNDLEDRLRHLVANALNNFIAELEDERESERESERELARSLYAMREAVINANAAPYEPPSFSWWPTSTQDSTETTAPTFYVDDSGTLTNSNDV